MIAENNRVNRERVTIERMIEIYCKHKHKSGDDLCTECSELLKYAKCRLENCKFGSDKPVCAKCKIHCYKKDMREKIRSVMRYSGPKMMFLHPILTIGHFIDAITNAK